MSPCSGPLLYHLALCSGSVFVVSGPLITPCIVSCVSSSWGSVLYLLALVYALYYCILFPLVLTMFCIFHVLLAIPCSVYTTVSPLYSMSLVSLYNAFGPLTSLFIGCMHLTVITRVQRFTCACTNRCISRTNLLYFRQEKTTLTLPLQGMFFFLPFHACRAYIDGPATWY